LFELILLFSVFPFEEAAEVVPVACVVPDEEEEVCVDV
jgi:hypothetical protein